ncbi:HAD-IB family phosphatase [Pseudonocardia sp.]|uniref:HAD family hydrolase n=1 Tax=Pseudonocardia sp. TaxID=60912 RepID=UPI0026231EC9|nr:HAD-IB family phosphatase [Pseudonocardia sp.]
MIIRIGIHCGLSGLRSSRGADASPVHVQELGAHPPMLPADLQTADGNGEMINCRISLRGSVAGSYRIDGRPDVRRLRRPNQHQGMTGPCAVPRRSSLVAPVSAAPRVADPLRTPETRSDTRMTRLHVFDMDGTLLRGVATLELSRHLGSFEIANAMEEAWLRGEVEDKAFWERVLPLWAGASEEEIDQAFEAAPWIDGMMEVFADIAARGEHSVVISQSPLFFVRRLQRWGAGAVYGAGVEPGRPPTEDLFLTVQHKVDITVALLDDFGLTASECVAYGDSTSDVLLFEWLSNTVAVNAIPLLRRLAAAVYDGSDLREAYTAGRALLDVAAAGPGQERPGMSAHASARSPRARSERALQ